MTVKRMLERIRMLSKENTDTQIGVWHFDMRAACILVE